MVHLRGLLWTFKYDPDGPGPHHFVPLQSGEHKAHAKRDWGLACKKPESKESSKCLHYSYATAGMLKIEQTTLNLATETAHDGRFKRSRMSRGDQVYINISGRVYSDVARTCSRLCNTRFGGGLLQLARLVMGFNLATPIFARGIYGVLRASALQENEFLPCVRAKRQPNLKNERAA